MSVELVCYVCDFFCRSHSFMKRPSYNNLFQIMHQHNFRNLNMVIFSQRKYLESQVNALTFMTLNDCFKVIKRNIFHYLMKSGTVTSPFVITSTKRGGNKYHNETVPFLHVTWCIHVITWHTTNLLEMHPRTKFHYFISCDLIMLK